MERFVRNRILALLLAAPGLLVTLPAAAQNEGQGQVIVTVLPRHDGEVAPNVPQQDLQSVKVNGKTVRTTSWTALRGAQSNIELVLLIDNSARVSLGRQMQDIEQFVRSLPPNIKAGIAYMQNGHAEFAGPLASDHEQVLRSLHLPSGGPGSNASPYFCLSDLARRWPSQDRGARREVVMVSSGVDNYDRRLDPDDPYVQAAITDSIRAGLVVYSIYWADQGRLDSTAAANNSGQSLLSEVTQATGGRSFGEGFSNPVSFVPYFDDLNRRLRNQYELGFAAPLKGKPEVESFKLKLSVPGAEVTSPGQVLITPAAGPEK